MARLAGKVALITGAGSVGPGWGNGKATAVLFAREGASVFAVDRNRAAAEETADHRDRRRGWPAGGMAITRIGAPTTAGVGGTATGIELVCI